MKGTTRVDLHCHSIYSDGTLAPRDIAEHLAANGVTAAALTDHDSIDGLAEFSRTLARRGVAHITGVEITATCRGKEAHLLGFGFDPAHSELRTVLPSLRQGRTLDVHSIAGSIRKMGSPPQTESGAESAGSDGRIDISEAIALIHRAGGCAVLAHPLILEPDLAELESLLAALKDDGLDGIEAIYESFTNDQRKHLCAMAKRLDLIVSGGTDVHDRKPQDSSEAGIQMPTELWKEFRDSVCFNNPQALQGVPASTPLHPRRRLQWRHFAFHFMFPTFLAIALFVTAIYAVFLPTFERSLLDRKREMIRELTNSAWSILAGYERDERAGRLTREQAQEMARSRVESLRYGREGKDYFWLQDMHPRIIMHPYRKDLNGKDVSIFQDPRGVRIFVKFADLVRRHGEGYIEYVWQWKDDPSRLVPKESYIKGFQPWGWIIGTGIYIEDVNEEIARVERRLVHTSLGISLIVVLLLLYVMRQSLWLERERSEAEESLQESTERYRSLVEATTEGTLLVMHGRPRYANHIFLKMLGCTQRELEFLDLSDLFPDIKDNERARASVNRLLRGDESVEGFDATMKRRDGTLIECVLTPSRISFAGGSGFILLTRDVGITPEGGGVRDGLDKRWHRLQQVVDGLPVGLFRARANSRGALIDSNPAAVRLLTVADAPDDAPITLSGLFDDARLYDMFLQDLRKQGRAERRFHVTSKDPGTKMVAIVAVLVRDSGGGADYIDGIVQDITLQDKRATELNAVVDKLQATLLFLHEPVSHIGRSIVFCKLDTPIRSVAALMSEQGSSAALIQSDDGSTVGIVTDSDCRARVVAAGLDRQEPVSRIMSSPLVVIPESAEIYEALLLMEQKGVQHLAVADEAGRIVGVVRNQELLQFESYGPIVLTREVEQAGTPEEVVACCRRAPGLARSLLNCGAHPRHVTRMISSVCDAATVRLIALAEAELGPSPLPFVFLALGSHGRQEMTLSSDQDNAIVYAPPPDAGAQPQVDEYLGKLSRFVCETLDRAGYPFCRGDVMAQNPKWCKSLSVWKQYFSDWIERAEPQQLLEFAIFFDFRPVSGAMELAHELRRHVYTALRSRALFFPYFAQNSLLFKPPVRLFGRILVGGAGGESHGLLDLKDAMMPIVSFARLYALRAELDDTHTLDRLNALVEAKVLPESSRQEVTTAYEFLMRLRLQHQAGEIPSGQEPDNVINYRRLGQLEETLLNQSFAEIAAVQKRISYDFLGGTS